MTKPFVIALTGSIGMGKTETLKLFAAQGIPVHDADAAVHRLYARGGDGVAPIAKLFPAAIADGAVDRALLFKLVEKDKAALEELERVIHPLVAADRARFVAAVAAPIIVLDIPLLFESGYETEADAVVVVSAPAAVQRARVLGRPGMTQERFEFFSARQMADAEKRAKADFVIETGEGLGHAEGQVRRILADIRARLGEDT